MSKRTRIFSHKDVLGVEASIEFGKFLNDVNGNGQLGMVINTNEIDITKEAISLIKKSKREGGSFAELMLTRSVNNCSIGVLGKGNSIIHSPNIGRDCDLTVLDECNIIEIPLPDKFIKIAEEYIFYGLETS